MTDAIHTTGSRRGAPPWESRTAPTPRSSDALTRLAANAAGVVRESAGLIGNLVQLGVELAGCGIGPAIAAQPASVRASHTASAPRGVNVVPFPTARNAGPSRRAGREQIHDHRY